MNNDIWTGCGHHFMTNSLSQYFKATFLYLAKKYRFARTVIFVSPHTTPFSPSCIALGCLKVAHWYPIIWASLFYFRQALPFTGRLSAVCPPMIYSVFFHKSDPAAFFEESSELFTPKKIWKCERNTTNNVHPECMTASAWHDVFPGALCQVYLSYMLIKCVILSHRPGVVN